MSCHGTTAVRQSRAHHCLVDPTLLYAAIFLALTKDWNGEWARLILLLISLVPLPFGMNIELSNLNTAISSNSSRLSKTAWRYSLAADITLVFHVGGVVINCVKLVLHLPVDIFQKHDVVGISKARRMDVGSDLNPWVVLQGLTKNPVDNAIEEGKEECTSLSNAGH